MNPMVGKIITCLLTTLLLTTALPAEAQQPKNVARIGVLTTGSPSASVLIEGFRQGLREVGYIEGQNILIEYRYAEGKLNRLPTLATELVNAKVHVIVTQSPPAVGAAHRATNTIPIVMAGGGDPVDQGYAKSLARPGGNVTGLSSMNLELGGKRLELFREAVPRISRIAVLWSQASGPAGIRQLKDVESAAPALGIQIQPVAVHRPDDFDSAFLAITKERANGLFVVRSPFLRTYLSRVTDFTDKNRLPAIYDDGGYVDAGGLMSYGASLFDLSRRAATYVDRILKGSKPGELPVEQPTKFEFVINLKTAKQIGLTIPPNVLARADRIIR